MYLDMAGLRTLFSYCKHRQIKYVWPDTACSAITQIEKAASAKEALDVKLNDTSF